MPLILARIVSLILWYTFSVVLWLSMGWFKRIAFDTEMKRAEEWKCSQQRKRARLIKFSQIPIPFVNLTAKCVWALTKAEKKESNSYAPYWFVVLLEFHHHPYTHSERDEKQKDEMVRGANFIFSHLTHWRVAALSIRKRLSFEINGHPLSEILLLKNSVKQTYWYNKLSQRIKLPFFSWWAKVPFAIQLERNWFIDFRVESMK